MDEIIKDLLLTSPGLSADKMLKIYQNNYNNAIFASSVYKHLRQLKRKGILINKGNRWYVNTLHPSISRSQEYSGG
ncbi:hypothetical protein R4Z09_13330 [Niallia oryzisoli]|uniref:Uncharacterized protein n=1 Tax=Niallia oryzisoli TaxID=1737571 RepID=A0ABZ2CMQ4_9BACI